MSNQKTRWAARADRYEARAQHFRAEAAKLIERTGHERDIAFLTQPGHIAARDRMNARVHRGYEMMRAAERIEAKVANLRAMASRNKGDAEAARQAKREATVIAVGDIVDSIYGRRAVVKVNAKTVRLEGVSAAIDKALVKIA